MISSMHRSMLGLLPHDMASSRPFLAIVAFAALLTTIKGTLVQSVPKVSLAEGPMRGFLKPAATGTTLRSDIQGT